ncbi:MAG: PH domain-containing protein [Candidatus Nanopelagicales bacterium]
MSLPEPGPATPAETLPGTATPPNLRRRTHPITPVINGVEVISAVALGLIAVGIGSIRSLAESQGLLLAVLWLGLGFLVVLAVLIGAYYLAWQRTEFFFDDAGDLRVDSGVLTRNERRVALSRLQSVDVERPLLGRIFGVAKLRIEVAGGGDSRVAVGYLSEAHATALRAEVIARAAGVHPGAGEAPENIVAIVPAKDLLISQILRSETVILLLLTVMIVLGTVLTEGTAGLVLVLVTGGLPLVNVFNEFIRSFNFTVAESPDGLRLRFGLLKTEAQTVPPGRVQAVEFEEPLLWRRRGWVRVRLNVAGQNGAEGETDNERVLLPVAPYEQARQIVLHTLPGLDPQAVELLAAPPGARWRAWFQWRHLGVGWNESIFVTRRGWLTRYTAVVPHARTQSVRVTQGPWQRRLGLASMHLDSTPGAVQIVALHRMAPEARQLAEEQLQRAARARREGPAQRWAQQRQTEPN